MPPKRATVNRRNASRKDDHHSSQKSSNKSVNSSKTQRHFTPDSDAGSESSPEFQETPRRRKRVSSSSTTAGADAKGSKRQSNRDLKVAPTSKRSELNTKKAIHKQSAIDASDMRAGSEEEEDAEAPQDGEYEGVESQDDRTVGKGTASKCGSWLYPDLLDVTNIRDNGATDMDVDLDRVQGYYLSHIIRAHSRNTHEGQDEDEADTWAVAFEPTLPLIRSSSHSSDAPKGSRKVKKPVANDVHQGGDDDQDEDKDADEDPENKRIRERKRHIAKEESSRQKKSSSVVATCGGNTVCLIDCSLGRIVAKYSHVEEEEFMCLAWTTLDQTYQDGEDGADWNQFMQGYKSGGSGRHDQANILAAAGRMGSIKLINPLQGSCYKYLNGHSASILRLKFSITNPRWLFSASVDGTARLWDIGSLNNYETEARCLAKFDGLDNSSVTAIGVSEKYLILGTEKGLMAQYNLFELAEEVEKSLATGRKNVHSVRPIKIYPPSQEWHESAVDEIIYIPHFSQTSYACKVDTIGVGTKPSGKATVQPGPEVSAPAEEVVVSISIPAHKGRGRPRKTPLPTTASRRSASSLRYDEDEGEFVFASREGSQGEIIVWEASKSTETDADLKTILEWPITEGWTKFTLAENMAVTSKKKKPWSETRQNILVGGTTDGKIVFYDLARKPKRVKDGNILAEKPSRILSHPDSYELFRDVTMSQDLNTIVAGDWNNRVFIWKYRENTML
ncbi:hypothetical protein EDD11_007527 [Mortierella claussenii]|nr:hypothetical protein EDD11_007527 [Mortierella claussenii]